MVKVSVNNSVKTQQMNTAVVRVFNWITNATQQMNVAVIGVLAAMTGK